MHEGFVNYNAGTLGASMVEGRISAGVVVGDGLRRRRRRVDHGHAVRRRQGADLGRPALPDRRQRRHRHLARRRLRRRGRHLRHRRFEGHHAGRRGREGGAAVRAVRAAVLAQQRHRRAGGPARARRPASRSTTRCTPTTDRAMLPPRRSALVIVRRRSRGVGARCRVRRCTRCGRPPSTHFTTDDLHGRRLRPRHRPGGGRRDDGRRGDPVPHAAPERADRAGAGRRAAGEQADQHRPRRTATATRSGCCSSARRRAGARSRQAGHHRRPHPAAHRRRRRHPRVPRRAGNVPDWQQPAAGRRRAGGADLGRRQRLRPARAGGAGAGRRAARQQRGRVDLRFDNTDQGRRPATVVVQQAARQLGINTPHRRRAHRRVPGARLADGRLVRRQRRPARASSRSTYAGRQWTRRTAARRTPRQAADAVVATMSRR